MTLDNHDDVELRALLRAHADEPPFDAVDWNALHTRITTRAQPLLHRSPAPWWQMIAGWSGFGIPAGALAAAALALLIGTSIVTRPAQPAAENVVAYSTLEEELTANAGSVLELSAEEMLEDILLESALW